MALSYCDRLKTLVTARWICKILNLKCLHCSCPVWLNSQGCSSFSHLRSNEIHHRPCSNTCRGPVCYFTHIKSDSQHKKPLELMDCCLWSLSVVNVSFTLTHILIMLWIMCFSTSRPNLLINVDLTRGPGKFKDGVEGEIKIGMWVRSF